MQPREVRVSELRGRYYWKPVEAPKTWRPRMVGEELVGFYIGKTMRKGYNGQYEVVIIQVPTRGLFMVSGVRILQLIDASGIAEGWPVVIVWRGLKVLDPTADGEPRKMKLFEVLVAEGDPLSQDEMPKIREEE